MKTSFLKKKILIPVLAAVIFLTTTAFKNDFFEIAKQIEIFTTKLLTKENRLVHA